MRGETPHALVAGHSAKRVGPKTSVAIDAHAVALRIDGQPQTLPPQLRSPLSQISLSRSGQGHAATHLSLDALPQEPGAYAVEIDVDLEYSLDLDGFNLPAVARGEATLSTVIEVVDEPTANYVENASFSLKDRVEHAWLEIRRKPSHSARIHIGLYQPEFIRPRLWARVGGEVVDASPWVVLTSWSTFLAPGRSLETLELQIDIAKVRADWPDAEAIDVIMRPDFAAAEAYPTTIPIWRGEWVFPQIPLDAEPITEPRRQLWPLPESLVKPIARPLTHEEAFADPPAAE